MLSKCNNYGAKLIIHEACEDIPILRETKEIFDEVV